MDPPGFKGGCTYRRADMGQPPFWANFRILSYMGKTPAPEIQISSSQILQIAGIVGAVVFLAGIFFAVCVWLVRNKDMVALKPQFEALAAQIPLINQQLNSQGQSISKIEGAMSVIPALTATVNAQGKEVDEFKSLHRDELSDIKARLGHLERATKT